jgi:signal transduction histidine kinase
MTGYSQKRLKNMYFFPCPTETRDGLTFFNNTIIIDDLKTIGLIQKTLQKKKTWKGVLKTQTLHRGVIWCSSTIIPILDAHEHITEYIVVQTDVTDIEIAQMHLRNSYKKLQELNQKKDEFLNIASHELRTPMTSIR